MLILQILSPYFEMDTLAKLYFIMGEDPDYLYHAEKKLGHKVFSLKDFEKKDGIIDDLYGNSITFRTCYEKRVVYIQYATIKSSSLLEVLPFYFIEHYENEIKMVKKQNFKCMLQPKDMCEFLLYGNNSNFSFSNNGKWVALLN